jgi:hypothetical protein
MFGKIATLICRAFFGMLGFVIVCMGIGLAVWLLSFPVDLVVATVQMRVMRSSVMGTVSSVRLAHSGEGTRPEIAYSFEVGGRKYRSKRIMPGFHGNINAWTSPYRSEVLKEG